ncbi:hypothetical protein [Oceanobacillus jordanicus]|uniref:Lipoprotein n=1 Tax=Oceanobacillus jordanicus TaxID=2867266 RepID=A0AAW5B9Z3_9BACI|nr:hypothetical protein [Oceanobacillus jordanicus]MCG3420967.1 hypothetical protein [Oceanobacillus jordanicus]
MKLRVFFVTGVLALFITACSGDQEQPTETSKDRESSPSAEDSSTSNTKVNKEKSSSYENELKMSESNVKLPTAFPKREVSPSIEINKEKEYKVSYNAEAEKVGSFSGKQYASSEEAIQAIEEFSNGKKVGSFEEGAVNLGHEITGYGEGATGHQYFSWEEGNWLLSISSLTQDEMDHAGIAKKIVEYLETHMLPAPEEKGIVYIDYPQGGNEVSVDVRWQEDNMIYRLQTTRVPLDALEMTASVS